METVLRKVDVTKSKPPIEKFVNWEIQNSYPKETKVFRGKLTKSYDWVYNASGSTIFQIYSIGQTETIFWYEEIELSSIGGEEKTLGLKERSNKIDLLEAYSLFLEKNGYLDTDWRAEEPFAIDEFLKLAVPSKKGEPNTEEDLGKR